MWAVVVEGQGHEGGVCRCGRLWVLYAACSMLCVWARIYHNGGSLLWSVYLWARRQHAFGAGADKH